MVSIKVHRMKKSVSKVSNCLFFGPGGGGGGGGEGGGGQTRTLFRFV